MRASDIPFAATGKDDPPVGSAGQDSVTVGGFLEQWLPPLEMALKPSTFESYRCNVFHHIYPRLGERELSHLSPLDLNHFYMDLLASGRVDGTGGLSPKTVHYVHTIVHRALRDAVRWGLIASNPAELCDPPRQVRPEISSWGPEQARCFLAGIKSDRLYALFLLALTTGMRRGEILGLAWDAIDLDQRRLFVRRALVTINYEIQISSPKAKRSRRAVLLDEATVAALKEWRARQDQESQDGGEEYARSDFVFTRLGGGPLHPHSVSQAFTRRQRRLGLPIIRFHDLRHTSASLALAAGIHPKVVSERLGHASVMITLDTYSHVLPTLQEEAASKIAALIV